MNTWRRQLLICLAVLVLAEKELRAYTDPGSGALLWQILMGGIVGCMFYFRRFLSWFKKKKN
jgi:hypothetical protein